MPWLGSLSATLLWPFVQCTFLFVDHRCSCGWRSAPMRDTVHSNSDLGKDLFASDLLVEFYGGDIEVGMCHFVSATSMC